MGKCVYGREGLGGGGGGGVILKPGLVHPWVESPIGLHRLFGREKSVMVQVVGQALCTFSSQPPQQDQEQENPK